MGGGLAGFCTARLFTTAEILLFTIETRGRLGGRIFAVDKADQPSEDGFDLG